jgi:Fe-S-cluster containining protein
MGIVTWIATLRRLHKQRCAMRKRSPKLKLEDSVFERKRTRSYASTMPIFYECQRCTACCRWPGEVGFVEGEIARLAAFKESSEPEFIQKYTRLRKDRTGLALQEKPNGECIFLDGNECSVQPVKPQQCRDFPNLWNFPGFEKQCCAIPKLVGEEEWRRLVKEATGSP